MFTSLSLLLPPSRCYYLFRNLNRWGFFTLALCVVFVLNACDGKPPARVQENAMRQERQLESASTDEGLFKSSWFTDSYWTSNQGERLTYDVQGEYNDIPFQGKEEWRTRRAYFSKQFYTESRDTLRKDLFRVFILEREAHRSQAEAPHYFQKIAILERDPFEPVRFNSFFKTETHFLYRTVKRLIGRSVMALHAFEGAPGEVDYELPKEVFLEEQFPLTLRAINFSGDFGSGLQFYRDVVLSEPFSLEAPKRVEAEFVMLPQDTLEFEERRVNAYPIEVRFSPRATSVYWFDARFPHALLIAETRNGFTYKLTSKAYFKRFH